MYGFWGRSVIFSTTDRFKGDLRKSAVAQMDFEAIRSFNRIKYWDRVSRTSERTCLFPLRREDTLGTLLLVKRPEYVDCHTAKFVLIGSFVSEYQKYLVPSDIASELTSWRDGEHSVACYY